MALGTPAALGSAASASLGAASATSGSFSTTAGNYIFAFINWQQGTSVPPAGTFTDSQSLTWTLVYGNTYDPGSGVRHRLQLYRAISNGSSMTVTCSPVITGLNEVVICSVIGLSGASAYIANTGFNAVSAGAPVPSLTISPRSDSTVIGWYFTNGSATVAPPTNYTEIQEVLSGTGSRIVQCVYDAVSAAQSATWADTNAFEGAALFELREPLVLTAVAGSYALGGTSTGLRAARKLSASVGSYGLTGTAAGLRAGRKLAAGAGSYSLTGSAMAFRTARRMTAQSGAYTVTWTAADLLDNAEIRRRSKLHQRRHRYGWSDYGTFYPGYGR